MFRDAPGVFHSPDGPDWLSDDEDNCGSARPSVFSGRANTPPVVRTWRDQLRNEECNVSDAVEPVVIVGAGPTGLALAAELKRLGISAVLLDRLEAGLNTSRAAIIHARTLEVLEPLGVVPDLLTAGQKATEFHLRERSKILATISFADLHSAYPFALLCPQNITESILLARLQALGGDVQRPCEVISAGPGVNEVSAAPNPNEAQVRYTQGGETKTIRARWVVGCDGMHSIVREQNQIPFEGAAYEESFVLADLQMEWPLGKTDVNLFFSDKAVTIVVPLPGDHFRVVATMEDAPPEPAMEDFQRLLEERGPEGTIKITRVIWASRFRIHHRVASALRKGRVLVCGDAAHVHSPAGGQGMNTGIQDAVALASALKEALDSGSDAALVAWEKKRLEIARSVVSTTDKMTKLATASSPAVKALRNALIGVVGHVGFVQRALAEKLSELDNK